MQPPISDQPVSSQLPAISVGPRKGTLDEFAKAIFGHELKPAAEGAKPAIPMGLALGVEKFKQPFGKHYRLVWIGRGQAWLAAEDDKPYETKTAVLVAGQRLAESTGAYFDQRTR